MARMHWFDGSYSVRGDWANGGKGAVERFLGFRFKINGEDHYGWARLNVVISDSYPGLTATLTGYAYETIPGKAIIAGSTEGPDDDGPDNDDIQEPNTSLTAPTPQPATLGMLALGAPALSIWRREENPSPISIP